MKRVVTVSGILLVILLAGSGCHNMRHNRGDMRDEARLMRMRMRMDQSFGHNRGMRYGNMYGMHRGMGFMRGMHPGMGMRNNMSRMSSDSIGWMPLGTGRRILESIPNVTESQKTQIEDLTKKDRDEMKKLREEMSLKMKDMMDAHRKEILNLLTPEQKKYIVSEQDKKF
jgi:hypothetical protein